MNKKSLFVVLISALTIMVSLTYQGTYSYFTSSVEGTGNIENNTSTTNTEELSDLIITNGENISNTTMIPGDSVTITFSVQNPNDIKVCFDLLWSNTENTFVNQKDLVYTLEDEDGTMLVSETQYPSTNTGTTMLLEGTSIGASETKTYTLTITYKETDEDQTADIGKTFNSSIIGELGECHVQTAAEYIASLATTSDEIVSDNTKDNNLRYIGANPNNYVTFNNELWRIIGVFNNIDNGSGTKETRIKLIRDESIGKYSWDNKPSGTGSSDSEYSSNDWTDSALQEVLNNGPYWNRTSGYCPSGKNGATTSCDFSTNGLTEEAKRMISDAVWNLGGTAYFTSSSNGLASHWYSYERDTTVYSGRPTEWTGKIGLMYPSDYGYATSGGSTTNREACLNTVLYSWNPSSDCYNNDWLNKSGTYQWTLTPRASYSYAVFFASNGGTLNSTVTAITYGVFPALYLNSNVKIVSGEGTESNPFILSL